MSTFRINAIVFGILFCIALGATHAIAGLDVQMTLNKSAPYYAGDEMVVSLTVTNSGGTPAVDLYIAVEALGSLFFYPTFGTAAAPYVGGVTVPDPLDATIPIFNFLIAEGFSINQMKWIAAFTQAGTTQILALDDIVAQITTAPTPTPQPTNTPGPTSTPGEFPGVEMVYIPPGSFTMGSPPDEPCRYGDETQHEVTLTNGFYMQNTEVTQDQWLAVMGYNPSYFPGCGGDCPVEMVDWFECVTFCNRLSQDQGYTPCYYADESYAAVFDGTSGDVYWNQSANGYRLPTEAEWEYACRAGTTGPFAFECFDYTSGNCGCGPECLDTFAWFYGNADSTTHPAGGLNANGFGLYDMHGNVFEWCWDWYGGYPSGTATDPTGASSGSYRVLRGGCWRYIAKGCRSAYRIGDAPDIHRGNQGFRLARSLN